MITVRLGTSVLIKTWCLYTDRQTDTQTQAGTCYPGHQSMSTAQPVSKCQVARVVWGGSVVSLSSSSCCSTEKIFSRTKIFTVVITLTRAHISDGLPVSCMGCCVFWPQDIKFQNKRKLECTYLVSVCKLIKMWKHSVCHVKSLAWGINSIEDNKVLVGDERETLENDWNQQILINFSGNLWQWVFSLNWRQRPVWLWQLSSSLSLIIKTNHG